MSEGAFLIGKGRLIPVDAGDGETPPCPDAKLKPGDIVKPRALRGLANFPRELVVAVAVPPGFSPSWALANLLGESRPLLTDLPSPYITYILVRENDPKPYLIREQHLLPSGKSPVVIESIKREERPA